MSDEKPDETPTKLKRQPSEIEVMGKIERMMEGLSEQARRRVAFVFADQCGLHPRVPNGHEGGSTHG